MITRGELETRLGELKRTVDKPLHGLFGPQSMFWRVNRESIAFLGAGRALLLQLAHPCIAQAIKDHSPVKHDPLGRYYRTMPPVFAMVYGSLDQAFEQARDICRVHKRIHGVLPEPVGAYPGGYAYKANEAHATLWVHATLWHTSLLCYELVFAPLTGPERDQYYAESGRFAALFGIPEALVPRSVEAFEAYMDDMIGGQQLAVGHAARDIAEYFFGTARSSFGRFVPGWFGALTAQLLPQRLHQGFGFPDSGHERASGERALSRIRAIYPRLPEQLRFVGPYQEAVSRVTGRPNPGPWTRAMNVLWLGRTGLAR